MQNFVNEIPSILELFLNIIEFVALLFSAITFFMLMINKYSKALKHILSPCGMGLGPRLRVMFICRKSQVKKRAFIEYSIIKTGGFPVINSEWHAIINGFKVYYSDTKQSSLKYSIPNCTPLINKEFSDVTARYFKYFSQKKVKEAFGIQDEQLKWVININIEEAYATPTCLLNGLLSQYNENWEEFIKRYVSTAYITENDEIKSQNVLSNELYFTFAWLLWGPSYELEYRKYWAGLCQLSYGDESNSIPAVADTETNVADNLKSKFLENEERRYGALISANVSLYDKKPFFAALNSNINPCNIYFYKKVETGELSFGVKINDFMPCLNYKSKKYYSTAYVWLLFEVEDEDYSFKPEKSVAFFEHANLANNSTYEFLISTLIDKSLKHFETIYSQHENIERKYRFVCAMNDKISLECINKYNNVMNSGTEFGNLLKKNISFETKHSPSEVFASYDEFFSQSKLLSYIDVSLSNPDTISALGQFYTDIYMEAFPDENERETFDNFIKYLKKSSDAYKYHIVLMKNEFDKVIGGCVFDYLKTSNTGIIEFLAVRNDLQSRGIGSMIYTHVVSKLSEDAHQINGCPLDYICCEIDSPDYSKAEIKKYLYFWDTNNYWHLDFNYIQPALSSDQGPVTGLWFALSPQQKPISSMSSELILSIIHDYMKYAMSIDDPETCKEYQSIKKELLSKKSVSLEKIIKI